MIRPFLRTLNAGRRAGRRDVGDADRAGVRRRATPFDAASTAKTE